MIQLRVRRAVRGRLTAIADGRDIWSKPVNALPERRMAIPLSSIIGKLPAAGDLTLTIREEP